ncbi:hypothetical protein GCM10023353_01990 [Tomitella cavernea]|uniref:Uncharacterized protein n=1 Tax=Tomitella cavernea TaxID=1387982 RepID=A0ABP9C5U7_9ACTN
MLDGPPATLTGVRLDGAAAATPPFFLRTFDLGMGPHLLASCYGWVGAVSSPVARPLVRRAVSGTLAYTLT